MECSSITNPKEGEGEHFNQSLDSTELYLIDEYMFSIQLSYFVE